jgi:hypothetical protein
MERIFILALKYNFLIYVTNLFIKNLNSLDIVNLTESAPAVKITNGKKRNFPEEKLY